MRSRYNLSWEMVPLRWDEYPFRPDNPHSCTYPLHYEEVVPANALHIPRSYTRADFWNLLPWSGGNLVWGHGGDNYIPPLITQDHPPFYHQCTLARDFITHWPLVGSDPSVVGCCGAMVPVVCAYCWCQNWRRCDSLARVGSFKILPADARMSPILVECDLCGLTSDYHIARCVLSNNFGAIMKLVIRGATTIQDVLRCVDGCARVGSPYAIAGLPVPGYELFGGPDGVARREALQAVVKDTLISSFTASVPALADLSGVGLLIMEYWQGREVNSVVHSWRRCTHSFPCGGGALALQCFWTDAWVLKWVAEMTNANPMQNDWLADHCDSWFSAKGGVNWTPNSWAEWAVIRDHACDHEVAADDDDDE